MRGSVIVLGLAALAACGPSVTPPPSGPAVPAAQDDTCGAAPYAGLVGQDATALERELILRQIRVLRPGMPMTEDFRPQRINFQIDAANRISRVFCG